MMVDSLAGIPLPSVMDVKIEKKDGIEGIKPIEESGDTSDVGLNIDKDNASRYRAEENKPEEGGRIESYNAQGKMVSDGSSKDGLTDKNRSINLEV